LAPPEEYLRFLSFVFSLWHLVFSVDWNVDQPAIVLPSPSQEPTTSVTKPMTPPPIVTSIDPEFEKRQKRAERFGIPLVEPTKPSTLDVRPFLQYCPCLTVSRRLPKN
jgi:hypothetical protein